MSVGFAGEVKAWAFADGIWKGEGEVDITRKSGDGKDVKGTEAQAGEVWAVALSGDGQYLVGTTYDGRINVWDLDTEGKSKVREMTTKGSFGMCIDLVCYPSFLLLNDYADVRTPEPRRPLHCLRPRKRQHLRLQQRHHAPPAFAPRPH